MNTNKYTTYGGEVVQVLGVNFDRVIFQGQFGKEGAHGKNLTQQGGRMVLVNRPVSEYTNWATSQPYGVGLSQMAEYFKTYFSAASQGRDDDPHDLHYDQEPMVVKYQGGNDIPADVNKAQLEWKVYPVGFPSFRRSNEDFAPEWRVECEVYESPFPITDSEHADLFARLKQGVGWKPMNPFSDPIAQLMDPSIKDPKEAMEKAFADLELNIDQVIDYYRNLVPALDPQSIEELLLSGASMVNIYNMNNQSKHKNRTKSSFGPEEGVVGAEQGGSGGGAWPDMLPGETDSEYMSRKNIAPSGVGGNYGAGGAPVMYTGAQAGPGSDDRHDLSYTQNVGGRWVDSAGQPYDDKGRKI
jgi:hypothetical protein